MSADAPRPRRVLFLADVVRGSHGGTEGQMHVLAAGLPPSWRPTLWVLKPSEHVEGGGFPGPTRCLDMPSLARPWTPWRLRRFARDVRREGFDLIHTFLADASVIGPIVGRGAGVPVLVSRRDLGFWQTPRFRDVLRRTGRLAAGYLANCEAVKARVVEIEHAHPDSVHVVRNGHSGDAFAAEADAGLRARIGAPPRAPIVVLLANYKTLKRPQDLVAALGLLKAKVPDVHALLVGHDYVAEDVSRWCAGAGVEGRVHVAPTRGPVVPTLKAATVGVLCSEEEGLSNAILEYMGCGLPVVATSVGGNPELVADGENGFLYPPGDVQALAKALERLLCDPALAAACGASSRRRFEEGFRAGRMVEETVSVYEGLVAHAASTTAATAPAWEVVEDLAALDRLADEWDALLTPTQLFLSPDWVVEWLRWKADAARPFVLVARDGAGRLVGLLPLARVGRRSLSTCGGGEGAVHMDVVAAAGRAKEVAEGALARLEEGRFRRVRFERLAEGGALRGAIRARRFGIPYTERHATSCPFIEAKGSFDDLLRARFPSHRKQLKARKRKALGEDERNLRRVETPAECEAALRTLFELHARRFESAGKRTVFAGESLVRFHVAVASRLAAKGRLSLTRLDVDGRTVAAQYAMRLETTLHQFQTGFDPAAAKSSPSQALMMSALEREVIGGGLTEFDLLSGDQEYKLRWATGVRREFETTLYRTTRLGRWSCLVRGAGGWIRSKAGAALRRKAAAPPAAPPADDDAR